MALNQIYDPLADAPTLSSEDHAVRVWETFSGTEVARVTHHSEVSGVLFAGKGERLISTNVKGTWGSLWLPEDLIEKARQLIAATSAKH